MEQCFAMLGVIFGSRRRKKRLRYLLKYKDDDNQHNGVEFENLMFDEINKPNYGTDTRVVNDLERDFVNKREYDRIVEEQRKVDELIDRKMYEEEQSVKEEEESYYEAQREAARAATLTMSLKERSIGLTKSIGTTGSDKSLTLGEVEDDFEDFLNEVKARSVAFRNEYVNNNITKPPSDAPGGSISPPPLERLGDGMSSEEDLGEWNKFTHASDKENKRLEPVGNDIDQNHKEHKIKEVERMFSINDDEDMGDFVRA